MPCDRLQAKLFRYDKIGPGEVLRCHKARITRVFAGLEGSGKLCCPCGKPVGIDKGSFIKMIAGSFNASGTKRNG